MRTPQHLPAVFQAVLVTFLWSTSWVLIKIGLRDIPALTFAGLRYTLAFLCLVPLVLRPGSFALLRGLSRQAWAQLAALGLLFYTVTQGAQFVGLAHLPANTVSLLLASSPVVVGALGIALLGEYPTRLQWAGALLLIAGALASFWPAAAVEGRVMGFIVVGLGVLANSASAVLGRRVNRAAISSPLVITTVSMGIGAVTLVVAGLLTQGLPRLSARSGGSLLGWPW